MAWIGFRKCKNGVVLKIKNKKTGEWRQEKGQLYVYERLADGTVVTDGKGGYVSWDEAKKAKSAFETSVSSGEYNIAKTEDLTLRAVADKYIANAIADNIAASTYAIKKRSTQKLVDFKLKEGGRLGEKLIKNITVDDINAVKEGLRIDHDPNGVEFVLRNANPIFTYAKERNWVKKNPIKLSLKGYQTDDVFHFLQEAEVQTVYRACLPRNLKLQKAIKVFLHTGLRQGEFLRMREPDIKNGHIQVISMLTKRTKTKRSRLIPIHKAIEPILLEVVREGWTKNRLRRALGRAIKRAHKAKENPLVGRTRCQDFRHTFASNYLQAGGTIADLMIILGHTTLAALKVYAHFQRTHLAEKINMVNYEIVETPILKVV